MAKIHGWKLGKYQPDPNHPRYVVDCPLYHMNTTQDVFWSDPHKNSYVLVEVPEFNGWLKKARESGNFETMDYYYFKDSRSTTGYIELASINGAGEIRWTVEKARIEDPNRSKYLEDEQIAAAKHFGLI